MLSEKMLTVHLIICADKLEIIFCLPEKKNQAIEERHIRGKNKSMTLCFLIQQLRTIKQCYTQLKPGRSSTPGAWEGTLNMYKLGIQEAHAPHLKKILWLWCQKLKKACWVERLWVHFYQQTVHYLKYGIEGHPCKCYHQGPCRSTLLYIYHEFRSITKCAQ